MCKHAQSCLTLCDPVDCSHQSPLSMGFSRQEYWSGLPFPPPRNLSDPGIKLESLASSALAGGSLPLCHLGTPLTIQIYDFGFWKNPMFNIISQFPTSNEWQRKRGYLEIRRNLGQGVGRASQLVLVVNNLSTNPGDARCGFDPWHGKIPWRRKWQPTPVFLPEKLHRQRSLVGYSPWGHKKLDTTEHARMRWYRDSDRSYWSFLLELMQARD